MNTFDLYQGDCLIEMLRVADRSVDMIFADLPYGTTQNPWDVIIPFVPLWEQYKRIIKPNGAIVLTASQPFASKVVMSNLEWFRHEWIWQKNRGSNFANTVREPFKEHEHVLIFSQGGWTYNEQRQVRSASGSDRIKYKVKHETNSSNYRKMDTRVVLEAADRCPSSVQKFNTEVGLHPTQKPVSLFEYLIRTYTNEGESVLDSCFGSGTTGVACMNTKRNFVGIEKDETYFKLGEERIRDAALAASGLPKKIAGQVADYADAPLFALDNM